MSYKLDIEQLLSDGKTIEIMPRGYSMYPLFVPGRDKAIVQKAVTTELKRGDVVLYRRDESILVIHRIYKVRPDGFYLLGDNQTEVEGPIRPDQIRGIMTAFEHNGKWYGVNNPVYWLITSVWLWMRPVRHPLCVFVAAVKRVKNRFVK